jgi:uncharacterized membrane protein YhaH (DUF805 family)
MYCYKCGSHNQDNAKYCVDCGSLISEQKANSKMTFTESISTCFSKYFTFSGRASRSEYWWFLLFNLIISVVAGFIDQVIYQEPSLFTAIISIGMLFPNLTVMVRRLHDTNHSGWWYLIVLTIIGIIPFFIWTVKNGDAEINKFGAQC